MNKYKVHPIAAGKKPQIRVRVPGSKSITNRALLLAALTNETCLAEGVLLSDDSRYFMEALKDLGFAVTIDEEHKNASITGCGGAIPKREASVYVGSAGTAARFLAAFLGVSDGEYEIKASEQMCKRPMDGLFASLCELGTKISYEQEEGHLPVRVSGKDAKAATITVDITKSSQFLSALLISGCLCKGEKNEELVIRTEGSHGMAYIDITMKMIEQFGGKVTVDEDGNYHMKLKNTYHAERYQIEPDVSAACYFYAMAAITGGSALVEQVHPDSMQGDIAFLDVLCQMGCRMEDTVDGILLTGPEGGKLKGITADLGAFSDQTMTLAAIAPYADGPVTITGISHIRYQESNRMQAVLNELTRMGIQAKQLGEDAICIYPGQPKPCEVETYDDHRMAMAFAVTGLRAEGIEILDPGCCRKTFAEYFKVLDELLIKEGVTAHE